MPRTILTFSTLHNVLAAERALQANPDKSFKCRPTPTPPGLSSDICGMSVELLEPFILQDILQYLNQSGMPPRGVHELD